MSFVSYFDENNNEIDISNKFNNGAEYMSENDFENELANIFNIKKEDLFVNYHFENSDNIFE